MKERLDVLLCSRGLAASREKAKAVIMAGLVYVNGQKEDKAGASFDAESDIEVRGNALPYVSRGGLKLEKAMKEFGLTLDGLVCMERTNIRYVTPEDIGVAVGFASIDVSFISLTKVLGPVRELLTEQGQIVCLIKPQFEAGREKVGKKGVVRDKAVHREVIEAVMDHARSLGFGLLHLTYSPIKGPEGNIEYLLHLQKNAGETEGPDFDTAALVEESHQALQG